MSSYSFGHEYGTDQINVGFDNVHENLYMDDVNDLHQINAIRDRELRLMKKINQYKPTHKQPKNTHGGFVRSPNIYSENSIPRENQLIDDRYNNVTPTPPQKQIQSVNDGFQADDVKYLQNELMELEKKNNVLVAFVFFLVIIVLIQYAKTNNDNKPMQFMILPSGNISQLGSVGMSNGIQKESNTD
jgi:hypothetical protein